MTMSASYRLHTWVRQCTKLVPQLGIHKAHVQSTYIAKPQALVRHSAVRLRPFLQGDVFRTCSRTLHMGQTPRWANDATVPLGLTHPSISSRCYATNTEGTPQVKESLWQRFKTMYKEYWYVLLPVHTVTSIVWYGSFYYIAKSGIDIVPMLERMGASEFILKPLRDTGAGYFAVAYAMYKIATPARYTVTLGGTTVSINYLKKWGYIKPMPSSEAMKEIFREKGKQLRTHRAKVLAKMNLRRRANIKAKSNNQKSDKP